MSKERLGSVLPQASQQSASNGPTSPRGWTTGTIPRPVVVVPVGVPVTTEAEADDVDSVDEKEREAVDFVRFCYRRRAVAWPELYDEMCAVAARGDYRGMTYEQLERAGIGLALAALPRLAAMVAQVIAEERGPQPVVAAG